MAIDPRNFLLNTDYELDKIVLFKEDKFTSTYEWDHGLDFTPLVFGVWATDENFYSVNQIGELDSSSETGYSPLLSVECLATDTKVKLTSAGNTNNTDLYFRVYAFEPPESTATVSPTSQNAKKFILNTDYNYCKLFQTGTFTQSNQEFTHGLGYIPQVMAWIKYAPSYLSGAVQPLVVNSEATNFKLSVTTNKLKFGVLPTAIISKIYWRIYYDEA